MATPKPRNTTRQREAGAASRLETRRRLLVAASEEFADAGYVAATVSKIAARAGVTVQTLYLAWGSKRALLRGYLESALAGQDDSPYVEVLPHLIDSGLAGKSLSPEATLDRIAHLHRTVCERAALGWKLYRDAAATDPEIAGDWQTLQQLRRETFTGLLARLPKASLPRRMTRAQAAETAWVIASPESYDLLVRTAGRSVDEYERWVARTLRAALLAS